MAIAEVCVIESFRRSYISCNLYYSKYNCFIPAQNQSYKKDFICNIISYSIALSSFYAVAISFVQDDYQVSLAI